MSRAAALLLLGASACVHDHALGRRQIGAMKNASPAISPWTGPVAEPIAVSADAPAAGADVPVKAVLDRVHGMAVEVLAATSEEKISVASGFPARKCPHTKGEAS